MKFKRGDKVQSHFGSIGVVRGYKRSGDGYMVVVNIDGNDTHYSEDYLKFYYGDEYKESIVTVKSSTCPKCKTPWKVTKMGASIWYDCINCKDTAENIIKSEADKSKKSDKESQLWFNFIKDDDFF